MLEKSRRNFYMYLENYKDWNGMDFSKEKSMESGVVFPLFIVKSDNEELPIGYVRIIDRMLEPCCLHLVFDVYSINNIASNKELVVIPVGNVGNDIVNITKFVLVDKESLIKVTGEYKKNNKSINDLLNMLTLPMFSL